MQVPSDAAFTELIQYCCHLCARLNSHEHELKVGHKSLEMSVVEVEQSLPHQCLLYAGHRSVKGV